MGAAEHKESKTNLSEICKKEYFKVIKKDFSEGLRKIKSTIHSKDLTASFSDESWVNYLLCKFTEYLETQKINTKSIEQILFFLRNMEEANETKHINNLELFLAKEIDEISSKKQSNCISLIYFRLF